MQIKTEGVSVICYHDFPGKKKKKCIYILYMIVEHVEKSNYLSFFFFVRI